MLFSHSRNSLVTSFKLFYLHVPSCPKSLFAMDLAEEGFLKDPSLQVISSVCLSFSSLPQFVLEEQSQPFRCSLLYHNYMYYLALRGGKPLHQNSHGHPVKVSFNGTRTWSRGSKLELEVPPTTRPGGTWRNSPSVAHFFLWVHSLIPCYLFFLSLSLKNSFIKATYNKVHIFNVMIM